jgi:hypothetical protein
MSASAKVKVIIKDACILFDLLDLALLESFYRLELIVITTPEVIAEITDEDQLAEIQPYIDKGLLQIDHFGVFENILAIVDTNPGLGLTDAAVLEAAIRRDAAILSSDKSLRNESARRGLIVKGLLWALEELYNQRILSLEVVVEKLLLYPEVNKRAPKVEISNLIAKLSKPRHDDMENTLNRSV